MKKLTVLSLFLLVAGCDDGSDQNQASQNTPAPAAKTDVMAKAAEASPAIPYSIALEGFAIDGFPGLHSAAIAGAPEKLVMIGGRRNGLHGFPQNADAAKNPAFPKTQSNDTIY